MVLRTLFSTVLAVGILSVEAQSLALQEMVAAEDAFVEMARTQNRRDAFLFYLNDSAITQGPQGPTKGKAQIQQQTITNDWLRWSVNWSEISRSGDFGFNTGPWEYYAQKTDEKPVAFGEFNSVWKKQADGSWRVALDIGITHPTPSKANSWRVRGFPVDTPRKQKPRKSGANELLTVENKFQKSLDVDRAEAYKTVTTTNSRLMFTGDLPYRGLYQHPDSSFLKNCPRVTDYFILGSETASSNDMGYVYGTASVHTTTEGRKEIKKGTFVRVWVKVSRKKWMLELDVLSF